MKTSLLAVAGRSTRLAVPALALAALVAFAACGSTAPTTSPVSGSPAAPSTSQPPSAPSSLSVSPSDSAVTTPVPSESATPPATPSVTTLCRPSTLTARVTMWEGAAGHRIAHVRLVNKGTAPCVVHAMSQPQLVDGIGSIVINGSGPGASAPLVVAPGAALTTLVQDSDYCKSTPIPPVTVAFVLGGGAGRIVASPLSPNDVSGVPPCLGAPGTAGTIDMQPWAP